MHVKKSFVKAASKHGPDLLQPPGNRHVNEGGISSDTRRPVRVPPADLYDKFRFRCLRRVIIFKAERYSSSSVQTDKFKKKTDKLRKHMPLVLAFETEKAYTRVQVFFKKDLLGCIIDSCW
jgi:hypothetical protein